MIMINSCHYSIGNAQTIGCREVESNYFSIVYNEAGNLFAVLADGSIDHKNGRKAAVLTVRYCVNAFLRNIQNVDTSQFMHKTALNACRCVQDAIYLDKTPHLSLTMALFINDEMQYFNVGVNKVYFYNGHNERTIGGDLNLPYSSGKCKLPLKNVIGIFSNGAHSATHPIERINIISSREDAYNKAQAIIETVKGKCLNNQLNATALLIEVMK